MRSTQLCRSFALFVSLAVGTAALETPVAAQGYTLVGTASTVGSAGRSVLEGRYLYVATGYGLEIFGVSTPASPTTLGTVSGLGGAYDICFGAGHYIYLAGNTSGVHIVDVATPAAPVLAATVPASSVGGQAFGVEVSGGLLFVFSGTEGVRIFDISSTPTAPSLLGSYHPIGVYHNDGVARGNLLYVADGSHGLSIFDISNPALPTLLADTDNMANSFDIAVKGTSIASVNASPAYIQSYANSAPVVDPLVALDSDASGTFFYLDVDLALEASGNYFAYAASPYDGCEIWSFANPSSIAHVQTISTTHGATGVTYGRGYLFVGANAGGVEIYHR